MHSKVSKKFKILIEILATFFSNLVQSGFFGGGLVMYGAHDVSNAKVL